MYIFFESFIMAINILKAHKIRAFLTILGILIGVTTIIFIHSVLKGAENYIIKEVSGLGASTLYISRFQWMEGDWEEEQKRKAVTLRDADFLKKESKRAIAVSPLISFKNNIKYKSQTISAKINGSNEDYLTVADCQIENGRFFTAEEYLYNKRVVVIGANIATTLFETENPLGHFLTIQGYKYQIIGVLQKRGELFGNSMDDETYLPLGCLGAKSSFLNSDITIAVKLKSATEINQGKDELINLLRTSRGLRGFEENNFSINQMSQIVDMYNQMTQTLQIVILVIGSLSLMVGGVGIMNIMLVSVTERTREIGVRKALGANRSAIVLQFLLEAILLCLLGGVIGTTMGFVLAFTLSLFTPVPAAISLSSILIGCGFTLFTGIFFGIYPALKAAKLHPIEALRYE